MPPSVLDECRGRYSLFRDRHDPEWLAAKKAEDEEAYRIKTLGAGMKPNGARNVARGDNTGSAGGKFMETKSMRPEKENANLEAVGRWMAERGLGREKSVPGKVEELPQEPAVHTSKVQEEPQATS